MPRSPSAERPKPKITAKKMICSMLPLDMASIGLIGTISRSVVVRLGAVTALATSESVERSRPMPGRIQLAKRMPKRTDNAVVMAYTSSTLPATRPSLEVSAIPAQPAIIVAMTRGTTTMRIKRMKSCPRGWR